MKNSTLSKFLLLNASCFSLYSCGESEPEKLNVLMLVVDDLRPELGCFGAEGVVSPNIDALAAVGTTFTRSYCNIPVSGASRASLLSGMRPTRDIFLSYECYGQNDVPDITPIGLWFKEQGYTTISNSKISHHQDDWGESWDDNWRPTLKNKKWDDYVSDENIALKNSNQPAPAFECIDVEDSAYGDGMTAEKTIADLERLAKTGEPFFLGCGFVKPHLPFNAPKKYWDLYSRDDIELPENFELLNNSIPEVAFQAQGYWGELRVYKDIPKWGSVSEAQAKELIHGYRAAMSFTDAQVGKVLDALKRTGLDKNTVVILFGDHGWNLGDHGTWCKHSQFETALNTPMIIHSPKIKSGSVSEIVEYVDIYPTLCELAGIEAPAHLEGESMRPLMEGDSEGWKNFAICKYQNGVTLVSGDYFYTEWHNRKDGKFQGRMLFDHSQDPTEDYNLAELPEYKELVDRLQAELEAKRGFDYN